MKKILNSQCANCLFSPDRIVSPRAFDQIIRECMEQRSFFVCHRSTMGHLGRYNTEVMCKGFYDTYPHLYQVLDQIGLISWIDLPKGEKLPTWKEMNEQFLNHKSIIKNGKNQ